MYQLVSKIEKISEKSRVNPNCGPKSSSTLDNVGSILQNTPNKFQIASPNMLTATLLDHRRILRNF
jgi:hypothetical protein